MWEPDAFTGLVNQTDLKPEVELRSSGVVIVTKVYIADKGGETVVRMLHTKSSSWRRETIKVQVCVSVYCFRLSFTDSVSVSEWFDWLPEGFASRALSEK